MGLAKCDLDGRIGSKNVFSTVNKKRLRPGQRGW